MFKHLLPGLFLTVVFVIGLFFNPPVGLALTFPITPCDFLNEVSDYHLSDLAVDGSIFVLTNGTVAKFTLGAPQPFSVPNLQNDISGAVKIHTDKSQNYIYLVDPKNSRILMLNKQGGLERQLVSDK